MGFSRLSVQSLQADPVNNLAVLIAAVSLLPGCNNDFNIPNANLFEFSVSGTGKVMYPQFDQQIRHYAIRCDPSDIMTLTATAVDQDASVSIDGQPWGLRTSQVELANPDPDQDILVEVFSGNQVGQLGNYGGECKASYGQSRVIFIEVESW